MNSKQNNSKAQDAEKFDIFLSYSRKDTSEAMLLKSAIQSLGYSVFYDQDVLEGDSNWRRTIARNIDCCSAIVFLRTENSVLSKWCQKEVNIADESERTILPVAFLRDQAHLPNSEELKLTLQPLQTTCISDFSTIAGIKKDLQSALEKAVGRPEKKPNSLLITEFLNSAAENLSVRYKKFLEMIGSEMLSADIDNNKFSLKMRVVFGDIPADLCIALNKISKRSDCYANCREHNQCPFYNAKDQTEYSVEAYVDFIDRARKSHISDLLEAVIGRGNDAGSSKWCGNLGIKYFFRERILPQCSVNESNDFQAVLIWLEKAVSFYDTMTAKLQKYIEFTSDVCEIFRDKKLISAVLNDTANPAGSAAVWELNDRYDHRKRLHFFKKDPTVQPPLEDLGKLCSVAIQYPEALKIKLEKITGDGITVKLFKYELDKYVSQTLFYQFSDWQSSNDEDRKKLIRQRIEEAVKKLLAQKCGNKFSALPCYLHDELAVFIKANPSLYWSVSQYSPSTISIWGYFFRNESDNFQQVCFAIDLTYHPGAKSTGPKTISWKPRIISDYIKSEQDETKLSEITGFPIAGRTLSDECDNSDADSPDELTSLHRQCRAAFTETTQCLQNIHNKVYDIYRALSKIDATLGKWKPHKAATILRLDSTRSSYVDGYLNNEVCWEYYLSPGTRVCRRLHSLKKTEYPVMFCIRFYSAGAQDASVGWCADHDFNLLSAREKELFWCYILSHFPEEVRDLFTYHKNAIFLKDEQSDPAEKKAKLFKTADELQKLLKSWQDTEKNSVSLMDQMFAVIEKAVIDFKIQTVTQ